MIDDHCPPQLTLFDQLVAQLLSFPLGRLWARVLPNVSMFGLHINPGPFTVKEHVRISNRFSWSYLP